VFMALLYIPGVVPSTAALGTASAAVMESMQNMLKNMVDVGLANFMISNSMLCRGRGELRYWIFGLVRKEY